MTNKLTNANFRKYFEKKVRSTIRKYKLCTRKDKIGVAVSGGKDSTTALFILNKEGYNVEAITIDALIGSYSKRNLKNLKKFCKENKIKLHIISFKEEFGMPLSKILSILKSKGYNYSSCMVCGILKRYLVNKYSKKLKFNCLATGHNLDDEAQAFLMNVFRNDARLALRQGPIAGIVSSKKFVKRVKPLYNVTEQEVIRYSKIMKFPVNYKRCPLSTDAYRREYRNILDEFEKRHPNVKYNIVRFHEALILPIKNKLKKEEIPLCRKCGEPASKDVCMTCKIFSLIKKKSVKT